MDTELTRLIQDMPKGENHVHLEGSISPELLLSLGEKNGVTLPFDSEEGANRYIRENTRSLDTFINVFNVVNSVMCGQEDFHQLVVDFAREGARENIVYREAIINFAVHEHRGIDPRQIVRGLASGRQEALEKYGVDLCFIGELDRSVDRYWAEDFVRRMDQYRKEIPLVAIGWALGLKGKEEDNFRAPEHREAFRLAGELGFYRTAHCGEVQGPESVWEVLENLEPDRIDHGVRGSEDPALVAELARRGTLLAVCPSTNVLIGLYPDFASHPVKYLMDQGVRVSVSTDDPAYILTGLSHELTQVALAHDLSREEVIELVRNSFRYSFAGKHHQEKLEHWLKQN